jgi:hypothetical protein
MSPRELKAFDRDFNDFIGKLKTPSQVQFGLRRSYPRPSPHWKRILITYYNSGK